MAKISVKKCSVSIHYGRGPCFQCYKRIDGIKELGEKVAKTYGPHIICISPLILLKLEPFPWLLLENLKVYFVFRRIKIPKKSERPNKTTLPQPKCRKYTTKEGKDTSLSLETIESKN